MSFGEHIRYDAKSLKKIVWSKGNISDLAKHCVAFANAQGWTIEIGREDGGLIPHDQLFNNQDIQKAMKKLRNLMYNVIIQDQIVDHWNNRHTLLIEVLPSIGMLASTSDWKYYIRKNDESVPVRPEDIQYLLTTKQQTQREIQQHDIWYEDLDQQSIETLCSELRQAPVERVSDFIKQKSNYEICEYYQLILHNKATNLWVLRCGTMSQKTSLNYPITVQYIVYDDKWQKVRKIVRDKAMMNPKELLLDIEKQAIELHYYHELSSWLFRDKVRLYPQSVIRELLINAFAHKAYTISADIFINVFPDRLEIHSPWWLPLWVSPDNILHTCIRRNPKIIELFRALSLIEWEWSWYDLIFEELLKNAKKKPVVFSDFDRVVVTIYSKITNVEHIKLIQYILKHFPNLSQKEHIALWIIGSELKIWAPDLRTQLQLTTNQSIDPWIWRLIEKNIVRTTGTKKGMKYMINESLIKDLELQQKPSLRLTTPDTLQELIKRTMKSQKPYSMQELYTMFHQYDIIKKEFEKVIRKMANQWILATEWGKRYRKYILSDSKCKKKRNEKENKKRKTRQ